MDQPKIILVEDDEFIQDLYISEFTHAGFNIEGYTTGAEAMKALNEKKYDLALLDIMLPDTNGLEILKHIKQDPKLKDLKCVMLSNLGQDEVVKEGFALGAQGYLIKVSYNPDQVVAKVREFLSGKVDTPPPNR